jgi:hypothetical protein
MAAVGAVAAWVLPHWPDFWEWVARILLPLVVVDLGWLLYRTRTRRVKNPMPDLLRKLVGGYYERAGMCFAPRFVTKDGICWLHLYVQNRYARGGAIRILMRVHGRRIPEADVDEAIVCGGGAVVVRRIPYVVPPGLGGNRVTFEIKAATDYPSGRGAMVRLDEGTPVTGTRPETNPLPLGCTFALLSVMTVGFYVYLKSSTAVPALYGERLPAVNAKVPDDLPGEQEVLWEPDLPTGGFPVQVGEHV